jgi:hypothetical protein
MDVTFTTNGRAAKRGRFVIADRASVDIQPGERVGVGIIPGKDGSDSLVHEYGPTQTAVPLYSVAQAVASGKVIPLPALVRAFAETGQLGALAKAIEKHEKDRTPAT